MVRFSDNDAKLLSKSPVNTFLLPESGAPKIKYQKIKLIIKYLIKKQNH
jgi:hypothetical protein